MFVNATRKRAKVLLWDGTGLCIYPFVLGGERKILLVRRRMM